jgi:hypothetical protein
MFVSLSYKFYIYLHMVWVLSIGILALFFILMSVRLIFLKDGEFRGTCASQSPWLNKEGATCGYCGKTLTADDTACGSPDSAAPPVSGKK